MGVQKKIGTIFLIIIGIIITWFLLSEIFTPLETWFYKIFNDWIVWVYTGLLLYIFFFGGLLYGISYSLIKRRRLGGTLATLFSTILMVSGTFFIIVYTFFTILFTVFLIIEIKLILLIIFIVGAAPIFILTIEKWFDISTYFKDLWKQRNDYKKLTYNVEEKGKLIYIHLQKNNSNIQHIFEAAATLKIEEVFHKIKKNPNVSLAIYIKSGLLFFITELIRNFTSWPRTKNRIYRKLAGTKIGKNVCISQWSRLDPLFPDLIEFKEGSGVGIGCQLLTHNFMNENPLSICIGPIKIEKNARIGAFSTILPGVTIGEGAIVGAGSVVADDIPPYTIAYGVPAKVIRTLNFQNKNSLKNLEDKKS
ncbi:MAG: acyltransferase [Candidatus Helarchaeota archaeon]